MKSKEDLNYCLESANTMFSQLFCSIDKWTYYSWGVSKKAYGFYKEMPTLMLKVSGAFHKGWVFISLNEGSDIYEVTLLNNSRKELKTFDEVYFDQLGKLIDENIEKPVNLKDDEYLKIAMDDSKKKLAS